MSSMHGGTAVEAITHSPAAVTFYVMSGVEHLYDVLISTHIAQDFAAYADPLTSTLMYRPHLLKGDLHTLANIPLFPTSRRSWVHAQAQTHFVCCTTHVVRETGNLPTCALSQIAKEDVVSDKGRDVTGDSVPEEFSDCSEYFEVTCKKKKNWNRAATALNCRANLLPRETHMHHRTSPARTRGRANATFVFLA
jgi:hypothetical protein